MWNNFPEEFGYVARVGERFLPLPSGSDDVDSIKQRAGAMNAEEISSLAELYTEICRRNDGPRIYKWLQAQHEGWHKTPPRRRGPTREIVNLFAIFNLLAKERIEPFASQNVNFDDATAPLDWSRFPRDLGYVIPFAEQYGEIIFDDQIAEFVTNAPTAERERLEGLANRLRSSGHDNILERWLRDHRETLPQECDKIKWLLNLVTTLGYHW